MAGPKAAVAEGKRSRTLSGAERLQAPSGGGWAPDFISAGATALLLLISSFFPAYWYLSFFALTPFLWKITRAGFRSGLRLGFLLGLAFLSVSKADSFFSSPFSAAPQLIAGISLFALFGASVGRVNEKWGLNPLITALLWVGFELGLVKAGFVSGILETPRLAANAPFFNGVALLFGFLTLSFAIVLVNSLLVFAVEKVVSLAQARGDVVWENESVWYLSPLPRLSAQKVYLVPEGRGPPGYSI
jgi:hypothetical protein